MRRRAQETLQFLEGVDYEHYLSNYGLQLIVERELQNLGEAARRVVADYRGAHPEINWQRMIGLRNVLAHEYGNIRHDLLWETARDDLPALIAMLDALLAEYERDL